MLMGSKKDVGDRPPPQNAAIATPIIENQGKIQNCVKRR